MNASQHADPGGAFLVAEDGCRIYLRPLKAGSGIPVVFVHALAMDGGLWTATAERLQTQSPAFAFDCRGHGRSDKSAGPYSTAQFADDILAVLDYLDAPQVHLVGCSMGGTVALAFAGRHPHRLASLTVIDATACYGEAVEGEWETRGMRPQIHGFDSMLAFQVARWFSEDFAASGASRIAEARGVFLRNDARAYLESCRMLGRADERDALTAYRGPALVLVGEEDYATPIAMAREIQGLLAAGQLKVLPGLRHFTPIEAPDLIAAEIDALILTASPVNQP